MHDKTTYGENEETIPASQPTYQQGRSTTEQILTFKVLDEKLITSEDYKVTILLLDMSKAFDTIRRKDLFDILKDTLE